MGVAHLLRRTPLSRRFSPVSPFVRVAVGVVMVSALAVGLVGCSDDPDESEAGSSQDGGGDGGSGSESGETSAPPTTLYAAVENLGLTPAQTACVTEALPAGSDPGHVPTEVLDQARADCTQKDAAQAWVDGLAESGAYTPEQLECLRNAYAALSPEDVQRLVEAAVNPQSPPEAQQIRDGLFAGCAAP
jgi:hypothetical protein